MRGGGEKEKRRGAGWAGAGRGGAGRGGIHGTGNVIVGTVPTSKCCVLEQETLFTLLDTGFYPGRKSSTWKISTSLQNVFQPP